MAEHIGQFCVVEYDKTPVPGVILDVGDSVYVKVMHQIGRSCFLWPMMDDGIGYTLDSYHHHS